MTELWSVRERKCSILMGREHNVLNKEQQNIVNDNSL